MQRNSFLGGPITEIVKYEWPITGLGVCQIGFGVCDNTGLVLQTTTVTPETMIDYYANTATYINPNHNGKPMPGKVKDLERLLQTVDFTLNGLPTSVLQLGSSDGYTLACFKNAGAEQVLGVEPGEKARSFALARYGIESLAGTAENFDSSEKFELVILTHVLEHLYDPLLVLRKLKRNLADDGHLLIEVPLWERLEKQPVGVLSFEHLNYFSEDTLNLLLNAAGFESVYSAKLFNTNQYPVITVVAKMFSEQYAVKPRCESGKTLLNSYLKKEKNFWSIAREKILKQQQTGYPTYIYGAGIHTSQLLFHVMIWDDIDLQGFIDSSQTKQGKELLTLIVQSPDCLTTLPSGANIIISSAASESYIEKSINSIRNDLNMIKLYS